MALSSTGTRKQRDVQSRAAEAINEGDKSLIQSLKLFSGDSSSVAGLAGGSTQNSPKTPAGNYLAREGDSMIGPIALGPPVDFRVEIGTDEEINISPTNENAQYSSNIELDAVQPNGFVLTRIDGAAFDGQILIVRTFGPDSFTISQATMANGGNIQTPTDNDVNFPALQMAMFVFDEALVVFGNTGGTWRLLPGLEGGVTFPLLYPKLDQTPAVGAVNVDLSLSTGNANQITFPAGNISLNLIGDPGATVAEETHIMFIQDGVGGRSLTSVDAAIKNGANMDLLLDKAANARTTFKLVTLDGGTSYHAELVDLVTLTAGYSTVQDEGTALTQRPTINFIGAGVTAVDNAGQTRTDVTIPGGGATTLTALIIDIDKSWLGFGIDDLGWVGSNAAVVPASGFVRMGTGEEIRMKNPAGTDDLIITSGVDALTNQAILFKVASGNQLTISEFDIDVVDNDIINTGDIVPGAGAHQVGDSTDFYNQMHSQFFVPEAAAIITNRYGLAKVGNRPYVNYDDTNADAGFGIYEEGIQSFLFSQPLANVHELFIGPDPFTAGETYRILLGENSNSSAKIELTEGANDLFIDRLGVSTNQSVALSTRSQTRFKVNVNEAQFFVPANLDANDMINVVNIKSNGGGGATTGTIGEVITNDGGFDYWMRSRLSWESDPDTFIEYSGTGIEITSDDDLNLNAIKTGQSVTVSSQDAMLFLTIGSVGANFFVNGATRFTIQDNGLVSQVDVFVQDNFVQYTEITTPTNPGVNEGRQYAKDVSGVSVPFWLDEAGTETSMIAGVTSPLTTKGDLFTYDTADQRLGVGTDGQILQSNSATATGLQWVTPGVVIGQTPWLSDIDAAGFDLRDLSNLEFQTTTLAPAPNISAIWATVNDMVFNVPTGDEFSFRIQGVDQLVIGLNDVSFVGNNIINASIDTGLIDSGILGIARGGTGNGTNIRGDILYAPANGLWSRLAVGAANTFLMSDGTDVFWASAQTPWTQNVDAAGFQLDNLDRLTSNAANPADTGFIRMGNGEFISWESSPAGADGSISFNSDNRFDFNADLESDINLIRNLGNSSVRWNNIWAQTLDLNTGSGSILGATLGVTNTLAAPSVTVGLSYVDGVKQTFNPNGTNSGLNVGLQAGEPSTPAIGDLFYDSTANQFKGRDNTGWINLGATGSSFPVTDAVFQVTDDIDVTKTWQVSLAGMTANDAALFSFSTSASRTYVFPDISGDVLMDSGNQSISGLKDFNNGSFLISNPANTFEYAFFGSAITADRSITLPLLTGNDTLVTEDHSQTLINKTIDGDLNTILDINETQMNVSVGAAGTVLTSNGVGLAPTYQAGGGGGFPVTDSVFQVTDDVDVTKTWQVSLATMTANDAALFNFTTTTSRTYNFPDISSDVMMVGGSQTVTGTKTFNSDLLSSIAGVNLGSTTNEFVSCFLGGSVYFFDTTTHRISVDANEMFFDVPSKGYEFRSNGSQLIAILANGTLDMSNENIDNVGSSFIFDDGHSITTNNSTIDINAGPTNTDQIQFFAGGFQVAEMVHLTTGDQIEYLAIVNNGWLRPFSLNIGISTGTTPTGNPGSLGTIEMPNVSSTTPTKAQLDGFFSTRRGSMAIIDSGGTTSIVVRSGNGNWYQFDHDSIIS